MQKYFAYEVILDLNDLHVIPKVYEGNVVKEFETEYVCETDFGNIHINKALFKPGQVRIESSEGTTGFIDDDGFETYFIGVIDSKEISVETKGDCVSAVNTIISKKIQKRITELKSEVKTLANVFDVFGKEELNYE
jgi:hypothetical protein